MFELTDSWAFDRCLRMRMALPRLQHCSILASIMSMFGHCPDVDAASELDHRLKRVVQTSPIDLTDVTWCIVDAGGTPISEHNSTRAMKPASTMKLLTTAAAFEHLPPLYQTKIWALKSEKGTVLRWVGTGDPMMGDAGPLSDYRVPSTLLSQLSAEIRRAGVSDVVRLEYDERYFQGPRFHPSWPQDQFSKPYRCESSALNFAGNLVRLELHPKSDRPKLDLFPSEAGQIIALREQFRDLQSTSQKDAVGFDRYPGRNEFRAFGVCRNHHMLESPVHDPARWAAELLATSLRMDGISVLQVQPVQQIDGPPQGKPIASATINTPLFRVISHCNTESRNLYAECLLKSLDRRLGGDGTWLASGSDNKTAGERLYESLSRLFPGTMAPGDVIDDGSGLSHTNRLTARTLAQILAQASSRDWYEQWLETFAKGRESGTLANRFRSKAFDNCLIRGKSGYIRGASTLAGRLDQESGQSLNFAIMVKNVKSSAEAKRLHESILAEVVRELSQSVPLGQNNHGLLPTGQSHVKAQPDKAALPNQRNGALKFKQSPEGDAFNHDASYSTILANGTGIILILLGIRFC